jgi:Kef-type K+ transport system membrane component KefB
VADFHRRFRVDRLTFLAGAEVDPDDFRERFGITLAIGLVSFAGPFLVAWLVAWGPLVWKLKASLIAGTALSSTSLAVVYAVLVESRLNSTSVGKHRSSSSKEG